MEDIEFINDAGFDRWKDTVQLTGEHADWVLSDHDFHWWKTGFGPSNFNLLVAVDKKTNRTVGSATSAYYESIDGSEPLMTFGMFFVAPDYRGIGLGLELFKRVTDEPRFKDINWGLDGVLAMTDKYASRKGYDKVANWSIGVLKIPVENLDLGKLDKNEEVKIVDVKDVDMEKIIQYDFNIQGKRVRRDGVVKSLLRGGNCFNKVALNKDGEIVGYGNIRQGYKNQLSAGPIYAETPEIASTLLREILESIPNLKSAYTNLWMFPAHSNKDIYEMVTKLSDGKFADFGACRRQFTRSAIESDSSKIFCATDYAMSFA